MMHQRKGTLGDVLREVADSFQVGIDLERGGQKAKIAGDRLVERQQTRCQAVNLHFHAIDLRLVADDLLGQFLVLLDQRTDATMDGGLHQPTHLQQLVVQLFKFDGEMTHPNSPSFSTFSHIDLSLPESMWLKVEN